MFRLTGYKQVLRDRLLGMTIFLIGATANTICGTIDYVSDVRSVEAQTYTVSCPATTEMTQAILLNDDVPTIVNGVWYNIINIAEVMVYGPITEGKLKHLLNQLTLLQLH